MCTIPTRPSIGDQEQSPAHFSAFPSQAAMRPPLSLLFSRLDSPMSSSFPHRNYCYGMLLYRRSSCRVVEFQPWSNTHVRSLGQIFSIILYYSHFFFYIYFLGIWAHKSVLFWRIEACTADLLWAVVIISSCIKPRGCSSPGGSWGNMGSAFLRT